MVLTSNSTSGSPGVTYRVYTDVTRTGETTAEVKYTIKSTPNGKDDCTKITGYLSVGNDRKAISLKSASTTWYGGSTYTSNGSYTITVKPKDSVLATAFEASGSGSYQTSYQEKVSYTYYETKTRPKGYNQYYWRVQLTKGHSGNANSYVNVWAKDYDWALKNGKDAYKGRGEVTATGAWQIGGPRFHQTGTGTYKAGPYTGYRYETRYQTHYTCTGTMAKRSGYDVEIDKWYYVTYDASGGTGAPAKTGKIGKNPIEIEDYPDAMQLVWHHCH